MIHVLLAGREESVFKELEEAFSQLGITTQWEQTSQNALSRLSKEKFDVFITDELLPDMTAKALIEKSLSIDAMINCVVLSERSHEDFHDVYEGLGVLMQFPLTPGRQEAQNLIDHLNRIAGIAGRTTKPKGEQIS